VALAHCGECHTPRRANGTLDGELSYAGTAAGPDGALVPNITPDERTGIGSWSAPDISWFLETGLTPDGNDTQGTMREVIEEGYSHLTRDDRDAIAAFLRALPPIDHVVESAHPEAAN
jgi:mono/diheme cytochrome c family protein